MISTWVEDGGSGRSVVVEVKDDESALTKLVAWAEKRRIPWTADDAPSSSRRVYFPIDHIGSVRKFVSELEDDRMSRGL